MNCFVVFWRQVSHDGYIRAVNKQEKERRKDHQGEDAEMLMMVKMMMMMMTTAAAMVMMIMNRKKKTEDIRIEESALFFDLIVSFCVEWLKA